MVGRSPVAEVCVGQRPAFEPVVMLGVRRGSFSSAIAPSADTRRANPKKDLTFLYRSVILAVNAPGNYLVNPTDFQDLHHIDRAHRQLELAALDAG